MFIYSGNKKYDVLEKDLYKRFENEFTALGQNYDLTNEIRLWMPQDGINFPYGLIGDFVYCHSPEIRLAYEIFPENKDIGLIHHILEYSFDKNSARTIEEEDMEAIMARSGYIYISGARSFEMSYKLNSGRCQLIFDAVTEVSNFLDVSRQLISLDVALYARPY